MSTANLKRALRIERNLTDSMKELLDTGEITKTFASDTIASLIKQTKTQKENINMTNTNTAQADTKYADTASKDNSSTHSSQLTNAKAEPYSNFMDNMEYFTAFGFLLSRMAYELAHEKKMTD